MELKTDEVAKLVTLLRSLYDQVPRYGYETWEQVVDEYLRWDNRLSWHLRMDLGIAPKKESA